MPQCQFLIFCCFCVSKKLHRKYSRNWTKQKPNLLLFIEASRSPKRRRRGATGRPHPWPAPPGGEATLAHLWRHPFAYKDPPDGKNLKTRSIFQKHIANRRRHRPEIGRVQKLFPAPCQRGKSPPEVFFIAMLASGAMSE
jgi:hypothetical protein